MRKTEALQKDENGGAKVKNKAAGGKTSVTTRPSGVKCLGHEALVKDGGETIMS